MAVKKVQAIVSYMKLVHETIEVPTEYWDAIGDDPDDSIWEDFYDWLEGQTSSYPEDTLEIERIVVTENEE